jgi:hypothetical protein
MLEQADRAKSVYRVDADGRDSEQLEDVGQQDAWLEVR